MILSRYADLRESMADDRGFFIYSQKKKNPRESALDSRKSAYLGGSFKLQAQLLLKLL